MNRRQTEGAETISRLREWARDQAASERLAAHVLRMEGFKSVDPSHPLGGPDGLKDIVCEKDGKKWIGAAFFPRGQQLFASTKGKFQRDLAGVAANRAAGLAFRRTHLDPELPSITAALDSRGGNYLEGLALGNTFRRLGYGTRVNSGSECYSAAAFAFLGGAFLGVVGGWGPDRTVEVGAKIGFHTFYSSAAELVGLGEGIEHGKRLAMILADYATALRIDMKFIIESLERGPHELLLLQTVQHFRDLNTKVVGFAPATELTAERAIIAANYATNWKRPVSLQPGEGETLAVVQQLTASDYHRNILGHLIAPDYCRGPMTNLIRATIQASRAAQINELFDWWSDTKTRARTLMARPKP